MIQFSKVVDYHRGVADEYSTVYIQGFEIWALVADIKSILAYTVCLASAGKEAGQTRH